MSYLIFLLLANYLVTARVFNATFNLNQSGISFDTIDTAYNPITAPSAGDTVTTGTTYPLKWTRTNTDFIEFKLFAVKNESYYVWVDLEFNVPADSPGNYDWSVAKTIPSGQNYVLTSNLEGMSQIFNVANPDIPAVSSQISSSASSSSTTTAARLSASSSSTSTAATLSMPSSSTSTAAGVSGGTSGTTTTKGETGTSGASSSGSGSVETGSSTAGPNTRGNNGLTTESRIGLGVGITFGVIAAIIGVVTFWYMPKRSRKTT